MDELIIDDKKYVSSKQAAKLTGYAKDYVGQLCREGRVQARLVGRAWYVLESAIQDHRFGSSTEKESNEEPKAHSVKGGSIFTPAWQPPRYEPAVSRMLPQIEERETIEETANNVQQQTEEAPETFLTVETEVAADEVVIEAVTQPDDLSTEMPDDTVTIEEAVATPQRPRRRRRVRYVLINTVRFIGIVIALGSATIAFVNSGYTDKYLYSFSQVHVINGISVYNK